MQASVTHEISCLLIGLIGLFWLLRRKQRFVVWKSALLLTSLALVAWCLLSISWAQEPLISAKRIIAFLLVLTGAAGMAVYWRHEAIVAFISISAAIHLTIGLIGEVAASHFTPFQADYRFAGTLPFNQEGFCCLVLVLSSLAAMDMNPRYRNVFRLLFVYGLIFLVLTKSRSSLMGVFLGLTIYVLFTRSLRFKITMGLWFGIVSAGMALLGLLDRAATVLSRNGEGSENLTGRVPLWEGCLQFIQARPATGYGYENFWTSSHIDYFSDTFRWGISSSHSAYLESALTLGFVGLLLHVSVLLLAAWRGAVLYRRSQNPIYVLATCLCAVYLLVGVLEAVLIVKLSPYSFYFFVLLITLCMEYPMERAKAGRSSSTL
jgi:O-antigen ligase